MKSRKKIVKFANNYEPRILSTNVNLVRAGHIAKAYGVMREGSGYR